MAPPRQSAQPIIIETESIPFKTVHYDKGVDRSIINQVSQLITKKYNEDPLFWATLNSAFNRVDDDNSVQNELRQHLQKKKSVEHVNENFREFNQRTLLDELNQSVELLTLKNVVSNYTGLCELICNYIILEDLLGHSVHPQQKKNRGLKRDQFTLDKINETELRLSMKNTALKDRITLFELNKPHIKKSHILSIATFIEYLVAFFFNKYPCDLFEIFTPPIIDNKVNAPVLIEKLNALEIGSYVKFSTFRKKLSSFDGHSMLIKKTANSHYSFYEPNKGEYLNLDETQLVEKINNAMEGFTHIAFLNGNDFMERVCKKYRVNQSDEQSPNQLLSSYGAKQRVIPRMTTS